MALPSQAVTVNVLYLKIKQDEVATLSNLNKTPDDLGIQGAMLAVSDNNTTGAFMDYEFDLQVSVHDDTEGAITALSTSRAPYVVLDMSAEDIAQVMPGMGSKLAFNIRAYDDELRRKACQPRLLHTLPSYAMRADALLQLLVEKRWKTIVLIEGAQTDDAAFAAAIRNSTKKFGMKIKYDVPWVFDEDLRRAASAEVPLFTQKFGDYDAMIVADELNDFARYLSYNTWQARPVFGADGLMAKAWSAVMEQWGAAQLQSRFEKQAGRDMQDVDYAAWAALRAIDEASIRTSFVDDKVYEYLLGDDFTLAGFKGRPLSFRKWNGQMRQPIGLVTATAVVTMAPLEGFLHASNELDSLGIDETQNTCTAFGG